MSTSSKDFSALVAALPEEDFAQLARCVRVRQSRPHAPRAEPPFIVGGKYADSEQLHALERAFVLRVEKARNAKQRLARLRLLLLFVLLRYGGLRLAEALALDDREDVDVVRSVLRVGGNHAREVVLPPPATALLSGVLQSAEIHPFRGSLACVDEGYLRRTFYARAGECGLEPGLASARALRMARAIELCREGMPPHIVRAFLGQPEADTTIALMRYPHEDVRTLIHYYLYRGMKMKTSARNVFPGRVRVLHHSGILVEVGLTTFTGLEVVAVITDESCRTLALQEGTTAIATVKAPWVIVEKNLSTEAQVPASSARNRFSGVVSTVRGDAVAREVVVELGEGSRVCALITAESAQGLELTMGDSVWVSFKAFSVVLTLE